MGRQRTGRVTTRMKPELNTVTTSPRYAYLTSFDSERTSIGDKISRGEVSALGDVSAKGFHRFA